MLWRPIKAKSTSGRLELMILISRCKLVGRAAEQQTADTAPITVKCETCGHLRLLPKPQLLLLAHYF